MGMASAKPKLTEKRSKEEDWLRRNRSLQRNEGREENWLRRNRSLLRNEAGKRIGFGETEAY